VQWRAFYDVAPDGTFVIAQTLKPSTNAPIVVVLSWRPGAK
jgi:hypothetical protein